MKKTYKSLVLAFAVLGSLAFYFLEDIAYTSTKFWPSVWLASTSGPPLPEYALKYAPYVYLSSLENFWPSDVAHHLQHTTPKLNFLALAGTRGTGLGELNGTSHIAYLTSNENVESAPAWLTSSSNKPDSTGFSAAPATIIVVEKDDGIVDVFYFYFYSYNQGPAIMGVRFGNHVGDWEHTMVRFINGVPQHVYLSAHTWGTSYTYNGIDKDHGRPIVYSAAGSHANYAAPGKHEFELPDGLLYDTADSGTLWDVTKNYRGYWYDGARFIAAGQDAVGVSWLAWLGRWGDEQYPETDQRQYGLYGQYHYSSGPTGPLDKNLERTSVCGKDECHIQSSTAVSGPGTSGEGLVADPSEYSGMIAQFMAFKAALVARNASYSI